MHDYNNNVAQRQENSGAATTSPLISTPWLPLDSIQSFAWFTVYQCMNKENKFVFRFEFLLLKKKRVSTEVEQKGACCVWHQCKLKKTFDTLTGVRRAA